MFSLAHSYISPKYLISTFQLGERNSLIGFLFFSSWRIFAKSLQKSRQRLLQRRNMAYPRYGFPYFSGTCLLPRLRNTCARRAMPDSPKQPRASYKAQEQWRGTMPIHFDTAPHEALSVGHHSAVPSRGHQPPIHLTLTNPPRHPSTAVNRATQCRKNIKDVKKCMDYKKKWLNLWRNESQTDDKTNIIMHSARLCAHAGCTRSVEDETELPTGKDQPEH